MPFRTRRAIAFLFATRLITYSAFADNTNPPVSARGASRSVFGYDPTPDFLAFDPKYREKRAKYARELRELQLELARQNAKGRATPCSRQIFLEARRERRAWWLGGLLLVAFVILVGWKTAKWIRRRRNASASLQGTA